MALVVVLAGGGTGGHIFPGLALADTIRKRDPGTRVHFIGTERGLEVVHIPAAGYPLAFVPSRPVLGRGPLQVARALLSTLRGVWVARSLLRHLGAALVIGVGGYASVPTVLAAVLGRIPTALIEPNARPGRANRLLGRFARAIFVQFDGAIGYFPPGRTYRTGIPVRRLPEARGGGAVPGELHLLVLGGSQGARSINRAITSHLDELAERDGFRISHQTGAADFEEVRLAYRRAGVRADVRPFFDDALERLSRADLLVARAGASTLAELCAAGVPSILVPYPHAADDHQMANARELEERGASIVIPDTEAEARLVSSVRSLAKDPQRRQRMAEAARTRTLPDAAYQIWDRVRSWR